MSTRSLAAAAVSAALLAGALHAAPSVEITNVQQQYPWTNTVDITYTVQGVNKTHQTNRLDHIVNDTYFATFEAKDSSGNPIRDTAGNTVFTNGLVNGNGTFTTQWQPANNLQLVANTATPSVFRGEENAYLVVNLETNKQGKFECWYEPMSTQEDSNKRYQAPEYKTTKMVFRRIPKGTPVFLDKINRGFSVTNDYYIGIYEVTVGQYAALATPGQIIAKTDANMKPKLGISYNVFRGSALPSAVVGAGIISTLNENVSMEGKNKLYFDLPTTHMWETAIRGNTARTSTYFW